MQESPYPLISADRADDLHHLEVARDCDLVLFMAGNQFMVLPELMAAFQRAHPEVQRIFYETLPPGLALEQILKGGAMFRDELLDVYPDIYTSVSAAAMQHLERQGHIAKGGYQLYLHNRLTLMVPAGNPARVASVKDLGRDTVRISQPDPRYEDIAHHIVAMYRQAGGEGLVHRIMEQKRAEGTTIYTVVHHRETPLRIAKGTVDVGPVWATEARHAGSRGLAFEVVEPGAELDQRHAVNYYICCLERAPHPANALKFLKFSTSKTAQTLYADHGFVPLQG